MIGTPRTNGYQGGVKSFANAVVHSLTFSDKFKLSPASDAICSQEQAVQTLLMVTNPRLGEIRRNRGDREFARRISDVTTAGRLNGSDRMKG